MFGEWVKNINTLSKIYKENTPVEHVIINDFLETPDEIYISDPDDTWFKYDNPFEGKYLKNDLSDVPTVKNLIDTMYSEEFLSIISKITGIDNLEIDPYLNAGGIHAYPRFGRSGIHLDYNIHPITGKERRISILLYMNKNWKDEWGGKLKVWDDKLDNETVINHSLWNTAVIFRTNGLAYHGFPEPIMCPEGVYRKAIGIYYMSEPTEETLKSPRNRAYYFPTPGKPICEKLQRLYEIRKTRRIEDEDLKDWPTWRQDCLFN